MPIYEYQCQKCDGVFEVMQSISAKPLKTCPSDGCSGKVQRLVSASGFILKGSGWYATDYPSEARKQGWESEQKQTGGDQPAQPAADAGKEAPAATAAKEKPAAKPAKAAKPRAAKSPYTSKGGKKVKTAKK
jgi:putative FmdB family regulatory protein